MEGPFGAQVPFRFVDKNKMTVSDSAHVDPKRVDLESFLATTRAYSESTLLGTLLASVIAPAMLIAGGTDHRVIAVWVILYIAFGFVQRYVVGRLLDRSTTEQRAFWPTLDVLFVLVGLSISVVPLLVPVDHTGINPIWFASLVFCAGSVAANILVGSGRVRCFLEISIPTMTGVALSGIRIGGFANVLSLAGFAYLAALWMNAKLSGQWFLAAVRTRLENERLVEQLVEKNSELFSQSETDPLTGLANRLGVRRFIDRVDPDISLGVVCLDLDEFKAVNDAHGHAAGDIVITAAAARLQASFRDDDLLVRLGGDEFLVIVRKPDAMFAESVPARIRANMETPLDVAGERIVPRVSIGVAIVACAAELELALAVADRELYVDKAKRRDSVHA
jgi:diguanylate cyclase (GGDEF)-like protein